MSTTNKLSQDELHEIATKALELADNHASNLFRVTCSAKAFAQAVLDQSAELEVLSSAHYNLFLHSNKQSAEIERLRAALAFGKSADAFDNLDGALTDIVHTGKCDAVCIRTIKRVLKQLLDCRNILSNQLKQQTPRGLERRKLIPANEQYAKAVVSRHSWTLRTNPDRRTGEKK